MPSSLAIPARLIKYRFDQTSIQALLRIKWWDWPLEKIVKNVNLINGADIKEFLDKYELNLDQEEL
jgi:virginiamycin A acetyltransferase